MNKGNGEQEQVMALKINKSQGEGGGIGMSRNSPYFKPALDHNITPCYTKAVCSKRERMCTVAFWASFHDALPNVPVKPCTRLRQREADICLEGLKPYKSEMSETSFGTNDKRRPVNLPASKYRGFFPPEMLRSLFLGEFFKLNGTLDHFKPTL